MSIKGWGDPPPTNADRAVLVRPVSGGYARLDITVLVPELALRGNDFVPVADLGKPAIDEWFGEDPAQSGSALVAIGKKSSVAAVPRA